MQPANFHVTKSGIVVVRDNTGSVFLKRNGVYSLANSKPAGPKKPYQKPTLRVYGDIREVTKTANNTGGMLDGGTGLMFIKTA